MFCLQKGCGYHLDLLVVAVMLGVCSIMGLPWFVAATVLSISHVNSLKVESGCAAPGEQPKFLGIREQRVTGFMIFVLMGCSVFMTSALKVKRRANFDTSVILWEKSQALALFCSSSRCRFCTESSSTWERPRSKASRYVHLTSAGGSQLVWENSPLLITPGLYGAKLGP